MFIRDRLSPQVKPLLSAVGQGDSGPVGIGGLGTKERLNEVSASRGKACRQRGGCRVAVACGNQGALPWLPARAPTQVEAVQKMRRFMKTREGSLRIHEVNGKIQEERTYPRGKDLRSSKG